MPMYESRPVSVTLIIEVDGHTLTFEATRKATGARYHGKEPPTGYTVQDSLESNIRGAVDTCITDITSRSGTFLARAYPTRAT